MKCQLKDYKEFIDNEMLLILGQMDKATLIFDHVYLVGRVSGTTKGFILDFLQSFQNKRTLSEKHFKASYFVLICWQGSEWNASNLEELQETG